MKNVQNIAQCNVYTAVMTIPYFWSVGYGVASPSTHAWNRHWRQMQWFYILQQNFFLCVTVRLSAISC